MNTKIWSAILILLALSGAYFLSRNFTSKETMSRPEGEPAVVNEQTSEEPESVGMANPASVKCEEDGGKLEIITNSDGGQFGMCVFDDYACEEWAYFRGECDIEGDAEKIRQALIDKGLDLTNMKVVINKHFGKYIGGGVKPTVADVGGGYVYAVKEDGVVKVLADGNGAIPCSSFEDYPDFPSYLVPECVDAVSGNVVSR